MKPKRYRLSVPLSDSEVIQWLSNQRSVSASVRVLVKMAIHTYGYMDATTLSIERLNEKLGDNVMVEPSVPKVAKKPAKEEAVEQVDDKPTELEDDGFVDVNDLLSMR